MEKNKAAQHWYREWSKEPTTKTAIQSLKDINLKTAFVITLHRIALACFNAKHYNRESDPGELYRQRLQKEKDQQMSLVKAAHTLMLSAKRNDKSLMWACAIAELECGVRITRKNHIEPMNHYLVVEKFFLAFETALKNKLPELDGGPFLDRFTTGNLILKNSISGGRPINTETMLAYELAFYLRMYTAGNAFDSIQNGQAMPKNGKPCFPVVAKFCCAVFGTSWDAKKIGAM